MSCDDSSPTQWSPLTFDHQDIQPLRTYKVTLEIDKDDRGADEETKSKITDDHLGKHPEPPLIQYRKAKVSVTDFSAQLWCERQLQFTLVTGYIRDNEAMRRGIARHEVLEREDHEVVPIVVNSREDSLGFRLLNMILSISILQKNGKVREVWACDSIGSIGIIRGIIDELKLVNDKVVIRDTKTRREKNEPGLAQKRTSAMQLQTYRMMLEHIRKDDVNWSVIFKTFKTVSAKSFDHPLLARFGNLKILTRKLVCLFQALPPLANYTEIEYECDGEIFKTDRIDYNAGTAEFSMNEALNWWMGNRNADVVLHGERWKCKSCRFLADCDNTPLEDNVREDILSQRKSQLLEDELHKDLEDLAFSSTCVAKSISFAQSAMDGGN